MSLQTPSQTYRRLLTLAGLFSCIGAYIADWNEIYIHNLRWPPHARFHNRQTMSMGLAPGSATSYYLWRPLNPQAAKDNLTTVTIFASLYCVTQLSAILYPGTIFTYPEFGNGMQVYICAATFTLIRIGYMLESRRIAAMRKIAKV